MFTHLCKIFLSLHAKPRTVLLLALLATLGSLLPLRRLQLRTTLSDLLPDKFESVKLWNQIGRKFGAQGSLAVVVHSQDSALNVSTVGFLADHLRNHPDVNFLEYKTESRFYAAHKLLYISLKDLKEVDSRVETGFYLSRKKHNPLILDLLDDKEKESSLEATGFEDLEKKYTARLNEYLGAPDGKTLVLRVYPNFDITDISRCRAFFRDVLTVTGQLDESGAPKPEILFTGDLMRNMQNEGRLYSQIIDSAKRSLALTALLLLLYFIRIPIGALLAAVPLVMAIAWTLALTSAAIGHLSLVTAPLGLLLVGVGLEAVVQLLARYREERRKNFSAAVAFETIILETGPAITTGLLVSAAAFLTLTVTEFKGFAEFGLIAGVGMLCTMIAVLVVYPCILILVEPYGLLHSFGGRIYNFNLFTARRYPRWRWHLAFVVLFTALSLHRAPQHRFEFNFDRLTFTNHNLRADSLLNAAGEAITQPAVVVAPNPVAAQKIAEAVRARMAADTATPTIQAVMSLTDLLPADQDEKLALIARLKRKITPAIIDEAGEPLRGNLLKLRDAWDVRALTVDDLPENYKKKFLGRDTLSGRFVFIFPSISQREGMNVLAFADDVRDIPVAGGRVFHASGMPVVEADLLGMIIPDTQKALLLALFTIGLLVFLDVRSLRGTLVLIVPLLFSLLWTLGWMKILGIKLSWYNLIAFPAMLAFGINNGVHFYHRYLEEGRGSLRFVLRRTGETTAVATLVGMAGFAALAFSDHQGLAALGRTALIGLGMSMLAPLVIMPMIIGFLEEKGIVKEAAPAETVTATLPTT